MQEHGAQGALLAHSGCVSAASAVLNHLREDNTLFSILQEICIVTGRSQQHTPVLSPRGSNTGDKARNGQAEVSGQIGPYLPSMRSSSGSHIRDSSRLAAACSSFSRLLCSSSVWRVCATE